MIEEHIPPDLFQEKPKSQWTKWVAAGGCVVLLCATVFIVTLIFAGPKLVEQYIQNYVQVAKDLPRDMTKINTMGNPKAPVHIIEYGDFQCPYCLQFWKESEPQLIKEYINTGKVYFEFRSFPILGPESILAAEGAYCAGDQNKFWKYHDTLFTNWTGENVGDFTKDKLILYAKALHLNMTEFTSCLNEEKHKKTVEQDKALADTDGVSGTPTLFINGYKFDGVQPFDTLKSFIEQILNGNLDTQNG